MDFNELKKKALEIKNKISEWTDKLITSTAEKVEKSKLTLHTKEDIDSLVEKSKNTTYTSSETWEEKTTIRRSIVLIGDPEKSFFKEALYMLPVIATKAFTQSITVKLAPKDIEWVDYTKYWVKSFPSMIVFENMEVNKIITGKLNILKLVKSFSLDINKSIDDFEPLEITSVDDLKNKAEEKAVKMKDEIKEKVTEKWNELKEIAKKKVEDKVEDVKDKLSD